MSKDPSTSDFYDHLRRGYEMEEKMSGMLLKVCVLEEPIDGLETAVQQRIRRCLKRIQSDTLRHQKLVGSLLEKFSRTDS